MLGAIAYQPNEAVLHTDERLLPRRRAAWASWNFHLTEPGPPGAGGACDRFSRTALTYWMNNLQSLDSDTNFCVSLNMTDRIDPAKVIRTIQYSHPVFTPDGVAAQRRHGEISGVNRTHYCGAYWRWGFHEDGVVSALSALERRGQLASRAGAGGMTRLRDLRRLGPPPPPHAGRARLHLPPRHAAAGPRRAARGAGRATRCTRPAAAPRRASAARTTWATRPARWPSACATWSRSAPATRPRGPVRLLTTLRTFGHDFNPVCFYYCFAPGGERVEAVVAAGDQHPLGREPRLRAAPRTASTR